MSIRILIADALAPEGAHFLKSQPGVDVTVTTKWTPDALAAALADHDGVVVRSSVQITADLLNAAFARPHCRLKAIARAGVGVDNIDLDTATRFGVAVMNSASASTITTAEHAFALMMALARNIGPAFLTMRSGGWDRNKFLGSQLHGKTLGVVGMGRIGQAMARRARAFGMSVIGYDPILASAPASSALDGSVRLASTFEELLEVADIVSFHVPKTDQTANMLAAPQFARAKKGLLVVNAARGGIIDEPALLAALDAGICAGAAIDVFEPEPLPADSPLRSHPKILVTPHLGASTAEAQEAVAFDACRSIHKFLAGQGLDGAVNAQGLNLDLSDRHKSFIELSRRMASLLGAVADLSCLQEISISTRGAGIASRSETIARYALAEILSLASSAQVTVINALLFAHARNILPQSRSMSDVGEDRLSIHTRSASGESHVIEGTVYADGLPRITNLDGYLMDMVAAGPMVILTNADRPGRIGLVGQLFGSAGVNIAEMVIGRRPRGENAQVIAMMVLKIDGHVPTGLIQSLKRAEGILHAASIDLPPASA